MRWLRWRERSRITKVRSERVRCLRVRLSSVWARSSAIGEPSSASSRKTQGLQANGSSRFWGIVANKTGVWKRFVGPSMSRDWPGTHGQMALTKNDEEPGNYDTSGEVLMIGLKPCELNSQRVFKNMSDE